MSSRKIKIRTGGQTGVDRAALNFAAQFGIEYCGWVPKGRLAEDGTIPSCFVNLQETLTAEVNERTELNARDSDGTLLLSCGVPKDGTNWTVECCKRYGKAVIEFDLLKDVDAEAAKRFDAWLEGNKIVCLNVAGPRESHAPGVVQVNAERWLLGLFSAARLVNADDRKHEG